MVVVVVVTMCNVRMSVHAHARCNKLKRTGVIAPVPSSCGGCGGCGADSERVWSCMLTRMQLIKTDRCQCTGPFGWTDQSVLHYACSLRRQVPGVPSVNLTQPRVDEKDCDVRPPHSTLHRRKGSAIFSISSALDGTHKPM